MSELKNLLDNNRRWAKAVTQIDPDFFTKLTQQQSPEYLWIGCSDSRVPANEIVGMPPGELFVHRNVANVVVHTDLNCLSVLQYAVDALKVKHIIVCGHYGCGGVRAVAERKRIGLSDNWLRHVYDVFKKHEAKFTPADNEQMRCDRLSELNVKEQVVNVCQTTVVQDAWNRGQSLSVHGWIYAVSDGLIRDLKVTTSSNEELNALSF